MANPDGTPIWFELTTDDQDKAQDFYAAVAGWTIAPSAMAEHGGYRMANAPDDEGVGGIVTPPPGMDGVPGWIIYFAASDVDAKAADVTAAGGTVHSGPHDIPGVGRFAMCSDPQGVMFNLMRGDSPDDSTAFKISPAEGDTSLGHGVWIELASPDPAAALTFYGTLFGWSAQGAMPMGEMGDYTFIGRDQDFQPGAIMSSATTGAPARWNWYVHVADIDAAVATARARGGTLLQGPNPIPGGSFSANLADAQGHQIGIAGPRKQ